MAEDRDDIVVLVDENGDEEEFEYIDTVEYADNEYVILSPVAQQDDEAEEEEIVILKIVQNTEGEESFAAVEDDKELDAVFEEFRLKIENEFEYDYDEDEEYEFDEEDK